MFFFLLTGIWRRIPVSIAVYPTVSEMAILSVLFVFFLYLELISDHSVYLGCLEFFFSLQFLLFQQRRYSNMHWPQEKDEYLDLQIKEKYEYMLHIRSDITQIADALPHSHSSITSSEVSNVDYTNSVSLTFNSNIAACSK